MKRCPRVGIAVSTIGRPELAELLRSLAASTTAPAAVAIADHTPGQDLVIEGEHPFPVLVVPSTGGIARGRNDAAAALARFCDVLSFPNDDSTFEPDALERVERSFSEANPPTVVAGTFMDPAGPRLHLPPAGTVLDRRTVWRAIEPSMFVQREAFEAAGGLRDDLGTGADSPWQSGDGTDLLLKILAAGGVVRSEPQIVVHGRGERRDLSADAFVAKHRAYARGTGYVYRAHDYPLVDLARILLAPVVKATRHDPSLRVSLRIAHARSIGRLEGLLGRPLTRRGVRPWI